MTEIIDMNKVSTQDESTRKKVLKARCDVLLASLLGMNHADTWWNSYNKSFAKKPVDVDIEEVYAYLSRFNDYS